MRADWYDLVLLLLFIYFGYYKAWKLDRKTNLGKSFTAYNVVIASVFLFSVFFMPLLRWPMAIEEGVLSIGRALMVTAIFWCIVELEKIRPTPWRYRVVSALIFLAIIAVLLFVL